MIRVLATIQHSSFSGDFTKERANLTSWVKEIHGAFYGYQNTTSGLTPNYIDQSSTFEDASGSTLMASTVYRLAVLSSYEHNVPNAELLRKSISATNVSSPNIDSNGWLTPVVNPNDFNVVGSQSPEAQSFVLILHAAWTDWVSAGSKGVNAGERGINGVGLAWTAGVSLFAIMFGAFMAV